MLYVKEAECIEAARQHLRADRKASAEALSLYNTGVARKQQ